MRWLLPLALLLAACSPVTPTPPIVPTTGVPSATVSPVSPSPLSCQPTDQSQFVYHPARLAILDVCIRVSGTVAAIRKEADGDDHILVALDAQYRYLLTPANANELGDLVVEPVCVNPVTQADAIAVCAADHDPLDVSGIHIGDHLWFEGPHVLDNDHGGWAEIHPLARYGLAPVTLPAD